MMNKRYSMTGIVALAVALAVSSRAFADPLSIQAIQDPSALSSFTLDFGVNGGPSQANISTTNYTLDVDSTAGTALFTNYHQDINPLLLPGGISTGDLTIDIVPGQSSGTYSGDGSFQTHDLYQIAFTGDLSAYGLKSPVFLPGDSNGQITFLRAKDSGTIHEQWNGVGQLASPFGPIDFTYTCSVNTVFPAPEPTTLGLLGLGVFGLIRRRR